MSGYRPRPMEGLCQSTDLDPWRDHSENEIEKHSENKSENQTEHEICLYICGRTPHFVTENNLY